ncbi:hypothetical protein ACFWGN_18555, partial [Oerskovia sp. NPDC060338]|uniref:phage tail protein n=1 Tax=Oerskovia sp. NPDC060338 TaxID=3347100 RepID=UPI003661B3D7
GRCQNSHHRKTSTSIPGSTRRPALHPQLRRARLGPAFESLTTWIETKGAPLAQELGDKFKTNVLPPLKELGNFITGTVVPGLISFGEWIVKNKDWLLALGVSVVTVVAGIKAYQTAMAIWKTATAAATAVQLALNVAMSANPIGIIILAIAALVAGLVYFFTQTETGKVIIEKVWGAIKTAISAVTDWWTNTALPALKGGWEAIKGFFTSGGKAVGQVMNTAWDIIKKVWSYSPIGLITGNWDKIMGFFAGIPGKVGSFFGNAINWLKQAGTNILTGLKNGLDSFWGRITGFFGDIPGNITRSLGDMGSLLKQAGIRILTGFLGGLKDKFEDVKDFVGGIGSWIAAHKGPKAYDLALLVPAGGWIMTGLNKGLKDQVPTLRKTLGGISDVISGSEFGSLTAPNLALTSSRTTEIELKNTQPVVNVYLGNEVINDHITVVVDGALAGQARSASGYRGIR